jgi:hypothetical protein
MAKEQHRPASIFALFDTAIDALDRDDYELLTHALLALGSEWKERERLLESVRYRLAVKEHREAMADLERKSAEELRRQRQNAGRKKRGKTKADPPAVVARFEQMQGQRMRIKAIEGVISKEFGISGSTLRTYRRKFFWQ